MSKEFKKLIAMFGLVAFLATCLVSVSFADRGDRREGYKRSSRSDSSERSYRHSRSGSADRHQSDDDDDDDDDDDAGSVPTPAPGPAPSNLCTQCHSDPGTTQTPSGHPSVGQTPVVEPPVIVLPVVEPPVVEPPVVVPPVVEPPVVEPPVVVPPAVDGQQVYNDNCAGCHGQSNAGRNVPNSHLSGRVNLTPAELDAVNAL